MSVQDKRNDGTKWLTARPFSILELLWEWSSEERKSSHWETVISGPTSWWFTRTGGTLNHSSGGGEDS